MYTKESLEAWYVRAVREADDNWQEELLAADRRKRERISQIKDEYARELRKLEAEKGE